MSLADRVQQQTGIPYALLDGRFDATAAAYRMLGALIGQRENGEAYAAIVDDTMKMSRIASTQSRASRRPRVYYARGPRGLETGLGGSINVETIESWRRTSPAARAAAWRRSRSSRCWSGIPMSSSPSTSEFAANVRRDPAWASVKAVRDGRVHLSPKMPFGWVDFPPSVNRLIGLRWLGKILYPDLFPEDLKAQTREFYRRFYHVTPSDAQIERVLAGRD